MKIGKTTDRSVKHSQRGSGLDEVARIAGVSRTTVSNVLHGKSDKMKKETWDKVQTALKESGYVPNHNAQILVTGNTRLIGVFIYENGFDPGTDYGGLKRLQLIEHIIYRHGYYMFCHFTKKLEEIRNLTLMWNLEGVIILDPEKEGKVLQEEVLKEVPVSVISLKEYLKQKEEDFPETAYEIFGNILKFMSSI